MSTVVNCETLVSKFNTLGWVNINIGEVLDGLASANIPATQLVAYLDAVIAAPEGVSDQAITGCPSTVATQITNYFVGKRLVVT